MIRLWVDDERPAPDGWTAALTSVEAIEILDKHRGEIVEMSLDHDLGGDDTTRRVVNYILWNGLPWPPIVRVHTANPVGREWLEGTVTSYGPGVTPW